MKTLATCRRNPSSRPATYSTVKALRNRGFTILELLVVLTLMAAMTGLALPQLANMFASGQRVFERRQVLDDIAALPYSAFQQQKGFVLAALPGKSDEVPLQLPSGWTLTAESQDGIAYRSNGICAGGMVLLTYDGLVERVQLAPPLCSPYDQ